MSGYVCTIAGGKGGVGKTTAAANLGMAFRQAGHEVAVIDADLGMANLAEMFGVEVEHSLHEVLAGDAIISDALTPVDGTGLSVLPGEQRLEAFADADPAKLQRVVDTLGRTHDLVVIDTGSGISRETAVPLRLADGVVLVTTPDDIAVQDAAKTGSLATQVDSEVVGALVSRVDDSVDLSVIEAKLDCPVLGVIPADDSVTESGSVVDSELDSVATGAFEQLTDALSDVFFGNVTGEDVDPVYDPAWIDDSEPSETDDDDDDDDDGGYSHAVFQGI